MAETAFGLGGRAGRGALALACVALAGLITTADARAAYFEGRTISIIVGFPAGGGVDLSARVMAEHLGKHVEGNPNVIVQNMTGGASMTAHNFVFERARPDGTTIFFGPWFPASQIVEAPGIRFRYEDFTLIAGLAAGESILYARAGLLPDGSSDPTDVMKVRGLKLAGSHPTNQLDMRGRLGLDLLGADYRYIRGFRGSADIRAAVLGGEVDAGLDSVRGYISAVRPTMVETGKAIPLWTFPIPDEAGNLVGIPDLPEVPTVLDVYREVHGKDPSGPTWHAMEFLLEILGTASHLYLGPPNMNEEAREALSKGIYAAAADPEYLAAGAKRFGSEPVHASLERSKQAIDALATIDPKVRDYIRKHVASGLEE